MSLDSLFIKLIARGVGTQVKATIHVEREGWFHERCELAIMSCRDLHLKSLEIVVIHPWIDTELFEERSENIALTVDVAE